jgi:hypothetical protein
VKETFENRNFLILAAIEWNMSILNAPGHGTYHQKPHHDDSIPREEAIAWNLVPVPVRRGAGPQPIHFKIDSVEATRESDSMKLVRLARGQISPSLDGEDASIVVPDPPFKYDPPILAQWKSHFHSYVSKGEMQRRSPHKKQSRAKQPTKKMKKDAVAALARDDEAEQKQQQQEEEEEKASNKMEDD